MQPKVQPAAQTKMQVNPNSRSKTRFDITILFVLFATTVTSIAAAHVVFVETATQPPTAGASYRGALRIGHGCQSSATTALIINIPEGFFNVKPMPKAGWTIETKSEKLSKPQSLHGAPVTESVSQITWRGGILPDAHFDEFVLMMNIASDAIGKRYFKISQLCEKGSNEWNEIPATEKLRSDYKMPAAELTILSGQKADLEHKH